MFLNVHKGSILMETLAKHVQIQVVHIVQIILYAWHVQETGMILNKTLVILILKHAQLVIHHQSALHANWECNSMTIIFV